MKHYKTQNGIRAIGEKGDMEGDQSKLVQKGWTEISYEEMITITNPPKTKNELEEERIRDIDAKTGELIYSKYSIEKQFNIGNLLYPYTVDDRENMFMFIETARAVGRDARDSGINVEEIDWLEIDKRIAVLKQGL